jgi:hypothetical protein
MSAGQQILDSAACDDYSGWRTARLETGRGGAPEITIYAENWAEGRSATMRMLVDYVPAMPAHSKVSASKK